MLHKPKSEKASGIATIKKTILESMVLKAKTFIFKLRISKAVGTIDNKISAVLKPSNIKIFDMIT